jgi:transcriptional regulator with XRE-family HTH domain
MADDRPSLAAVLQRWMKRERLRPPELAAAAGLTKAHLWLLLHDRIKRPVDETLFALARGIAIDPDGLVNDDKRRHALREICAAVGVADLSGQPEPGSIAAFLIAYGKSPQVADFWERFIAGHPDPDPTRQQLYEVFAESIARKGPDDVKAWLDAFADDAPLLNGRGSW